jgi:predicted tellurium resistance membrane protein TerC
MSLDNVLAVAGAAKDHVEVLVIGLGVSILLMAVAANFIAKLLVRYRWIGWVGLAIVLYVALEMIWRGSFEVAEHAALLDGM